MTEDGEQIKNLSHRVGICIEYVGNDGDFRILSAEPAVNTIHFIA